MKTRTKIIITAIVMLLYMVVYPSIGRIMFSDDNAFFEIVGVLVGIYCALLIIHPICIICLSIMAGTEIRKLWWIPFAMHLFLPVLYSISARIFSWETIVSTWLSCYELLFLGIGVLVMVIKHIDTEKKKRKRDAEEEL